MLENCGKVTFSGSFSLLNAKMLRWIVLVALLEK